MSRLEAPGALVERATWPPLRTVEVDGWLAGLSEGLTRRANSVVALGEPADPAAALDEVAALYDARGLPSVFRVDAGSRPAGLPALLASHGYRFAVGTDVLVRDLAGPAGPSGPRDSPAPEGGIVVAAEPDDAWLAVWLGSKAAGRDASALVATARAILLGADGAYVSAVADGRTVGIARLAYAGGWAALSCVAVATDRRRRGWGAALTGAALDVARRAGCDRAFLQVETDNAGAARLYDRWGFARVDGYTYVERPHAARSGPSRGGRTDAGPY